MGGGGSWVKKAKGWQKGPQGAQRPAGQALGWELEQRHREAMGRAIAAQVRGLRMCKQCVELQNKQKFPSERGTATPVIVGESVRSKFSFLAGKATALVELQTATSDYVVPTWSGK